MINVFLFDDETKVPDWWSNYVDYANETYDYESDDYLNSIHKKLVQEYRAKFKYTDGVRTLTFQDERDYMAMVLKWS